MPTDSEEEGGEKPVSTHSRREISKASSLGRSNFISSLWTRKNHINRNEAARGNTPMLFPGTSFPWFSMKWHRNLSLCTIIHSKTSFKAEILEQWRGNEYWWRKTKTETDKKLPWSPPRYEEGKVESTISTGILFFCALDFMIRTYQVAHSPKNCHKRQISSNSLSTFFGDSLPAPECRFWICLSADIVCVYVLWEFNTSCFPESFPS